MSRPPVPSGILHPPAVWVYDWVVPVIGSLIIVWAAYRSVRAGRLTWGLLFLVSSLSTFWLETMGDWGQELVYSPAFAHYSWDWMPWHTQTEPYFMPFAYAVYWTVHAWIVLRLAQWLATRRGWTLLKAVLVLSIPVNYVWDLSVETFSAYFGWWTYDPGFGPVIAFAHGRQPWFWPVTLMIGWPNFVAYVAGKPTSSGLNVIERWFRLDRYTRPVGERTTPLAALPLGPATGTPSTATIARTAPAVMTETYEVVGTSRAAFELRRLASWLLVFQVSFFVMLVVPLVLLRTITGHDSVYVP